jgi:hypothetical protein
MLSILYAKVSSELMDDDFAAFGEIVEIVRPLLHHAPPLGKVSSVIVGGADLVALVMDEIRLHRTTV